MALSIMAMILMGFEPPVRFSGDAKRLIAAMTCSMCSGEFVLGKAMADM